MTTETEVYSNLEPHFWLAKNTTHLSLCQSHTHTRAHTKHRGMNVGTRRCLFQMHHSGARVIWGDVCLKCCDTLPPSHLLLRKAALSTHSLSHARTHTRTQVLLSVRGSNVITSRRLWSCYQRSFSLCLRLLSILPTLNYQLGRTNAEEYHGCTITATFMISTTATAGGRHINA